MLPPSSPTETALSSETLISYHINTKCHNSKDSELKVASLFEKKNSENAWSVKGLSGEWMKLHNEKRFIQGRIG